MFVDTNYFLRYLIADDKKQYEIANQLFLDGSRGKIKLISSTIVFFETYWVLKSYYSTPKERLLITLKRILQMHFINFGERDILEETIRLFGKTTFDLEDCYNVFYAKTHKIKNFKTFDEKLIKQWNKETKN